MSSVIAATSEPGGDREALAHLNELAASLLSRLAPVRCAVAASAADREEVFRLHYRAAVYRGWLRPEDLPRNLEREDAYERTVLVGAWNGRTLGAAARLIFPADGERLPVETAFGVDMARFGKAVHVEWRPSVVVRSRKSLPAALYQVGPRVIDKTKGAILEQDPNDLMRFYAGWPDYQSMLVDTVAPLTPDQLSLQAAPNQRPIWLIAAHIIGTRVGWFHTFLGEGDPSIAAYDPWDSDSAPSRTAPELVAGLTATWTMIENCLTRWTPNDLAHPLIRHRPNRDVTRTRGWVIWHVIEHDIHHGAELFLTLGIHGLPTPDM